MTIALHYYCMSMYKTCGCIRGHELLAFAARNDMSQGRWISVVVETRCVTSSSWRLHATPLREGSAACLDQGLDALRSMKRRYALNNINNKTK
jgi:hypothetical protein